jgi:hypothetical protein
VDSITESQGRYVTPKVYAAVHGVSVQSLANWRYQDKKAKRSSALPGKPEYRFFGRSVRYWLPARNSQSGGRAA